jgi:hypothetical protein
MMSSRRAESAFNGFDRLLMLAMQISTALRARVMRRRQARIESAIGADGGS